MPKKQNYYGRVSMNEFKLKKKMNSRNIKYILLCRHQEKDESRINNKFIRNKIYIPHLEIWPPTTNISIYFDVPTNYYLATNYYCLLSFLIQL